MGLCSPLFPALRATSRTCRAIAKFFFKRLNEVKQNSRAANRDNMSEKELRKERMRQESWNTSPEDLSVDQFFHIYGHSEGINTNK